MKSDGPETPTTAQQRMLYADLWLGAETVALEKVEGETVPFCFWEWELPKSSPTTPVVLPDNVPNIPGDLPVLKGKHTSQQQGAPFKNWPTELLGGPFIKCKQKECDTSHSSPIVARVSGIRSCILPVGSNCWIRLKGSGNNSDGFVIRDTGKKKEIRGCAFFHTALLECYTSELLARTLRDSIPCNQPLGWYTYPSIDDFTPVCIVMQTLGDRRLGSHLLAGLEILLEDLITEDCIDEDELVALFPTKRRIDRTSPPYDIPSAAQLMVDHCLAGAYNGLDNEKHGVDFPNLERDHTIFADCSRFHFHERTPPCPSPKWAAVWPSSPQSPRPPVLAYLFSRLGADAGRFLRELHDAHYSWGTYTDAMCLPGQLHCNAHSNNLVVVPPDENKTSLLCYLDLDMAFPTSDLGLFEMEHRNFAEVLVGAEMSSGVVATKRAPLTGKAQLVLYALQDLMLQSYLREYKRDTRYASLEYDAALHTAAYELIQMALVTTCDIVA